MGLGVQIVKLKSSDFRELVKEIVSHLSIHGAVQETVRVVLNAYITRTDWTYGIKAVLEGMAVQ